MSPSKAAKAGALLSGAAALLDATADGGSGGGGGGGGGPPAVPPIVGIDGGGSGGPPGISPIPGMGGGGGGALGKDSKEPGIGGGGGGPAGASEIIPGLDGGEGEIGVCLGPEDVGDFLSSIADRGRAGAMVPNSIEASCFALPPVGRSSSSSSEESPVESAIDHSSSSGRTRDGRLPVGVDESIGRLFDGVSC